METDKSQLINKKRSRILVAGDAMLDKYHFGKVERISPEAPVPVFLDNGEKRNAPGGAANVAVNVAAIGVDTDFLSVVGEDESGRVLLSELAQRGIDTRHVIVSSLRKTVTKIRYIGQGNQQILRVDEEEIAPYEAEGGEEEFLGNISQNIEEYGLFVLSDYLKGFLTEKISQKLILLAKENNIPVLVDVKDLNIAKYKGATLLKPNRKELAALSGMGTSTIQQSMEAAIELCRKAECEYVLATLGADGMILANSEGVVRRIQSVAKEVYDVTGAGDTSIAYLAAEILKGNKIEDAMIVANYAAGVQVSKVGTSIVLPEEVYRVMQTENDVDEEMNEKLLSVDLDDVREAVKKMRESGKRIVFTNGCFDILHVGHISYLKRARALGDILIVGLNTDESVKKLKGQERPVNPLQEREVMLAVLPFVDYIIPFAEDTPAQLIEAVLPDVLVKGGDYVPENIVGADTVIEHGGEVRVLPFVEGHSTSNIIQRICKG